MLEVQDTPEKGLGKRLLPKVVFTDRDGTFADQGGDVRPEALEVKDKLIKKGILVILISGRSGKETGKFVEKDGFSDIFVAELGTVIFFKGKEIINHGNLRKYQGSKNHREFIDLVDRQGINSHDAMFQIGIVDRVLAECAQKGEILRIFTPKDGRPGEEGTNIMQKKGTVLLRGLINDEEINKLLEVEAPFLEILDNGLVEDESGDHAYHLLIKGANKQSAVRIVQDKLGISEKESVAFGDSLSDLQVARVVGRFFLMKNALIHTPDILEKFRISLIGRISDEKIEQIMERITVTKYEGSLGWAEVANQLLTA